MSLDTALTALRAAGEETRLRLLRVLRRDELSVGELAAVLGQSQPRISRHLKVLVQAGLVHRFREGSWSFHRLAGQGQLGALLGTMLDRLEAEGDPVLAGDDDRLRTVKAQSLARNLAYFESRADMTDADREAQMAESAVIAALREAHARSAKPWRRVADLGAGTGRILLGLSDLFDHGVGVDVSPAMLRAARGRVAQAGHSHIELRHGDILSWRHEERYDAVIIHQVLHHLSRPQDVLGTAARLLAPQGAVFVVDFAPHEVEALRERHAHRRLGFEDAEVSGFAQSHGLELCEAHPVGSATLEGAELDVRLWCARQVAAEDGQSTRNQAKEAA